MLQLAIPIQAQGGATPVPEAAPPEWSVDPGVPGADLPGAGASLFDLVTADAQGRRQVPFPFERLLARIEAAAGCSERAPCTQTVLIPLGRSLQRVAASPDFFAHPRVVTAVVGSGRGPFMLRDRLYLGYQDKSDVIEVIGYNEAQARFEFQLVKNYRNGAAPEVVYAARTMCVTCHQNHAPIFSRQVWLETNANPLIAARLAQQHATFHGVPARTTTNTANAIDDATDRANRIALVQRLWRDGCGDDTSGDQCRRYASLAALQYGLTGGRTYDRRSAAFQSNVVETLARNAASRWPVGIAVPNPDIPNRDPLAFEQQVSGIGLAHIPARFEPLLPRAPLEVLEPDGRGLADELVKGLTQFWSSDDFEALDGAITRGNTTAKGAREVEVPCAVEADADRLKFACGKELAGTAQGVQGTLESLAIDGAEPIRHLQIANARRVNSAAAKIASFSLLDAKRTARLPDGNAVQKIVLKWTPGRAPKEQQGTATITVRNDFAEVFDRVAAFTGPIRSAWIGQLTARLRGESPSQSSPTLPAARADLLASQPPVEAAMPFEAECGSCHHTPERAPPNFLTGDARQVARALTSCAPRIFVRLAMRDVPPDQRDKTPMPPAFAEATVPDTGSPHPLADARKSVEALLRREYGHLPTLDELMQRGYENLRPCLPPRAVDSP